MARFLDRLMLAESGGRDDARNPRSTAVGPFQFIESTFLEVCRRHLAAETAALSPMQILALRTNRPFARRAAEAYTRDNAAALASSGIAATSANLRLAFLLGAGGAVRVLKSEPLTPLIAVVGAGVVQANPFMAGMAARDLVAWSGRNLQAQKPDQLEFANSGARSPSAGAPPGTVPQGASPQDVASAAERLAQPAGPMPALKPPPAPQPPPKPVVTCNLDLPSCRKHMALAERRLAAQRAKTVVAQPGRRSRVR